MSEVNVRYEGGPADGEVVTEDSNISDPIVAVAGSGTWVYRPKRDGESHWIRNEDGLLIREAVGGQHASAS